MTLISLVAVILLALGCQGGDSAPAAAEPDEQEPGAQAEDADKEVLIASRPDGADVLLDGAKVGVTPMKMLVRGKTNVLLDKEGYVQQALLITPGSEPNIVVELVPSGEESRGDAGAEQGGEQAVAEEEADQSGSGSRKRGAVGAKKGGGSEGSEQEEQGEKSEGEEKSAASEDGKASAGGDESGSEQENKTAAKSEAYQNMDQLKRDLRDGRISRQEYREWQAELRAARARELAELKKRYEAEEISRDDFRRMAAEIKSKYEGR
ncbi:MAG: PEGA domain-containing protein [Polyangia bacterium]